MKREAGNAERKMTRPLSVYMAWLCNEKEVTVRKWENGKISVEE